MRERFQSEKKMLKTGLKFLVVGLVLIATVIFVNSAKKENQENQEIIPGSENLHLIVKKRERILQLFDGEKLVKTYKIALGFAPAGDKEREGDGKTPEGEFYIFTKNPKSNYYLSLGLSYPNVEDAERGLKAKIISQKEYKAIVDAINNRKMPPQKTRLGGEIYIHGGGAAKDWTWGCVALADADIKELFETLPVGAKVLIEP